MLDPKFKPIMAKSHMLSRWKEYGLGLNSQDEFLELLNIFQAWDTSLENVYESWQNGDRVILDICGRWETAADLMKSIRDFNVFYTDKEFIDFILEQVEEFKEEGYDDPVEEIRHWTFEGLITDTVIEKTEDGYVKKMWY